MAGLQDYRQERLRKLASLKAAGFDPYVQAAERTHLARDVHDRYDELAGATVTVAGRVTSIRLMGGVSFIDLTDPSGKVQVVARKADLSADAGQNRLDFSQLRLLDTGDHFEVTGEVVTTKTGEKSVMANSVRLLSKALRPLPEGREGLKNRETRYRQRYVDLRINPDVRNVIDTRIAITRELRAFLEGRGFVEIETPVLQPLYGGASARPFTTYHHKLETELFLRIADELYLKRAIMSGYEKVYEIGHNFRNEGIDPAHNPEFTMLEFYWAYADYNDLMDLTEEMLRHVCQEVLGTTTVTYKGKELDFAGPFPRVTFRDAIMKETGVDIDAVDREILLEEFAKRGIDVDVDANPPMKDLLDDFYKATTRPHLTGPLFMLDYPVEMIPLAKPKPEDPTKAATMQLVINGEEIIKAYNELNDPVTQLENWRDEQAVLDAGESDEAQPIDYDFIRALEYGMPPTAGWGMGIDRLTQILTNQESVKDTILFPTLRPEDFDPAEFDHTPPPAES